MYINICNKYIHTYIYIYIYIYTAAYIIYTITLYNQSVYWHCGLISWFLHGADFRTDSGSLSTLLMLFTLLLITFRK